MAKKLLKVTETNCTVKMWGTNSTDTLAIATDLKRSSETVVGTPLVNITAITWFTAGNNDHIHVLRNGEMVLTLSDCGQLDLNGNFSISDDTNNNSDIQVVVTGAGGVYLSLRKLSGYASHIEPEFFGSYDNPSVAGA